MTTFTVFFFWQAGAPPHDDANHVLYADGLEVAKMQAAMLYATLDFSLGCPAGYQILQKGEIEVYRYPEPSLH
jgi:hypothetical protein